LFGFNPEFCVVIRGSETNYSPLPILGWIG